MLSTIIQLVSLISASVPEVQPEVQVERMFSENLKQKVSSIKTSEEFENFQWSLKSAIFETKNQSIVDLYHLEEETSSPLENIVKLVIDSESFKKSKELISEENQSKFLDSFSLNGLRILKTFNQGKNSKNVMLPIRSFSNLFIDMLLNIKPEADLTELSQKLASLEVKLEAIYKMLENFQNSPIVDSSITNALKIDVDSLKESCNFIDNFSKEYLATPQDENNKYLLSNALFLRNYIVSIASAVKNLVDMCISEPCIAKYNNCSTNIYNFFESVLFLSIQKIRIDDFMNLFNGEKVGIFGKFIATLKYLSSAVAYDPVILRQKGNRFYVENFFENVEVAEPITEVIVNPVVLSEDAGKKSTVLTLNPIKVSPKVASSTTNNSKRFLSYMTPVAIFVIIVAIGFVLYGIYKKKTFSGNEF